MKQSQNKPYTHIQMSKLKPGFTPSEGPNRKQRRAYLQKITRKVNMALVDYIQWIKGKSIYHFKKTIGYN